MNLPYFQLEDVVSRMKQIMDCMDRKKLKINEMWNKKVTKSDERMLDPLERQLLGKGGHGSSGARQ